MKTLRTVNATGGTKNVGFRSITEIERALDAMRGELDTIDETLRSLEVAVVTVKIDGRGSQTLKGRAPAGSRNSSEVLVLDAPSVREIEKNFSLVSDLDDKLKSLDSMLAQLAYQFKNERSHADVVREVKALRADVEARVKKAYASINKIATGNVSKAFEQFCARVSKALLERLDGLYAASSQRLFIDVEGRDHLRFTHYIRFEDLQDDNGHVYREYNVCLTHLLGAKVDAFYVNSTPVFRVPGRFNRGIEVETVEGALDAIENLLASEGFKSVLHGNDLPISQRDVDPNRFAKIASKFRVADDHIEFVLNKGIKPDAVINDLFLLVKGLVDGKAKGQQIRYQTVGNTKIRFFLTNKNPLKLNRTQLKVLQNELGLSDEDVKRIMQEIL